ncbi:MAG: hypothetical protein EXX96DRAFT_558971 [Benjaminiella poitrasii]|nr:MAG: hypothetical protein EXX96DRAFT_592336 [Benjaminiella poitrasii]KAI9483627.1 MAG: hypothetical protein EXX96DRAFT_558971 [Benjaminiella poitrasii]
MKMINYETVQYEWIEWQPGDENSTNKKSKPDLHRLADLDDYEHHRNKIGLLATTQSDTFSEVNQADESLASKSSAVHEKVQTKLHSLKEKKVKSSNTRGPSGNYRKYTAGQIQELLDLVIDQGMSARQAGITERFVKAYKDGEQICLPLRKERRK